MSSVLLFAIAIPVALILILLIYWFSLGHENFGNGIALLCLLVASPCISAHDSFKELHTNARNLLPKPQTQGNGDKTLHRKAFEVIADMVEGCVGSVIISADAYMAYVFNPSLFHTHEVTLSGGWFEWAASLQWIATPAMFGIVALQCAGIVKSSEMFPELSKAAKWIVGIISFVLMCLSILLVTYAYAFRGVKVFDPTNTLQAAQMGESLMTQLGSLIAAASLPALVAVMNALSTLLTILLSILLVLSLVIAKMLHGFARMLDAYCLILTEGEWSVFLDVDKPLKVIAREFRFSGRRTTRRLQAARSEEEQQPPPLVLQPPVYSPAPVTQTPEPEKKEEPQVLVPVVVAAAPSKQQNGHQDTQKKKALKGF